jgi:nitrogen PTS system EIIA component
MQIHELLTPQRILVSLPVTSKKRLLEELSELLAHNVDGVEPQKVLQCLIERERLGSTGIGEGVALPHGRIKDLGQPLGAFVTLASEMEFDAIDHKPVKLIFALLVPEAATAEHLKLLAQLATLFRDTETRGRLAAAQTPQEAYSSFTKSKANTAKSA